MSRKVAIVGVGHSKFGRRIDTSFAELGYEAIEQVFNDSGLSPEDIQYVIYGNVGGYSPEGSPAGILNEFAGLNPKGTQRVEAACASGSAALFNGYQLIRSGYADIVLVVGIEKMMESDTPQVIELLARLGNYFWEVRDYGITFPGYYALFMTRYMNKYGATEEDLCKVAVKNHYYGARNPKAQYRREITLEDCVNSRYIARPIKLYDCSAITDGSAAVILASEELAKKITDTPIWIKGIGSASASSTLSGRLDYLSIPSAFYAANKAYEMAGIDPDNPLKYFDVAEVHDCFTIAEVLAYEDLKFAKRGEGIDLIREEQTYIGGKIPINLSGGLKAKGHPIGATGVSMAVELSKQLRGEVEKDRQAPIKNGYALAHNVGGIGQYAYVTIFSINQ